MQHKIIKLILVFVILFSLQVDAQNTEDSKHPKMDKYYPPAPTLSLPKNPQTTEAPAIKPNTEVAPEPTPDPVIPEAKPAPVITSTVAPEPISKPSPVTTPTSTIVPPVISQPVASVIPVDTTTKETPVATVEKPVEAPPQPKPLVSKPVGEPYNPNRLGSSTKEYDTWEKNNDGAGSVTTHSK
jgi:hypothetical protein